MIIPDCIKNAVTKLPTDNDYFYGADMIWSRLEKVRNNQIDYIPYDMATLSNCLEMYYKGIIEASGIIISEHTMKESHYLPELFSQVNERIVPLIPNMDRTQDREVRIFLKNVSEMYISTRYKNAQPSFDDFCAVYDFVEKQRELIFNTLLPPKEKYDMDIDR